MGLLLVVVGVHPYQVGGEAVLPFQEGAGAGGAVLLLVVAGEVLLLVVAGAALLLVAAGAALLLGRDPLQRLPLQLPTPSPKRLQQRV